MTETSPFLVTADWLEAHLKEPGLSIVDASWYLPAQNRDALAEYEAAHIPRAVFFDHDAVVDPNSKLPHTLPDASTFARHAGSMGIAVDDTIVVYDGPGLFSAPRVWWMFRVMGAAQRENPRRRLRPLEAGGASGDRRADEDRARPVRCRARRIANCFTRRHARCRCEGRHTDCRCQAGRAVRRGRPGAEAPACAAGTCPAPRACRQRNCRATAACCAPDELRQKFEAAGIDLDKPVVTSCGSGITAAIITLALETLGHPANRLYDGSWTEWGSQSDTPVETGQT